MTDEPDPSDVSTYKEEATSAGSHTDTRSHPESSRSISRLPTEIDRRYQIEEELGKGAMGVVYLATDRRLGRQVAVKLVNAGAHLESARLQSRLEREAQALARVEHPNVVGIFDVGLYNGQIYITMQYVRGIALRDWQQWVRSFDQIVNFYLQAARGLVAAHSRGIIHRDFKPDNVIVGEDNVVRVLDFGIAAAIDSPSDDEAAEERPHPECSTDYLTRMTRTGMLLGTPTYMSPEQLRGEPADAKSDQFAFCVALWEAISGERPFKGRTPGELLLAIESPPQDRKLPRWLRAILLRGLRPIASERHANLAELILAIERGQRQVQLSRIAVTGLGLSLVAGLLILQFMPAQEPSKQETSQQPVRVKEIVAGTETVSYKILTEDPAGNPVDATILDPLDGGRYGKTNTKDGIQIEKSNETMDLILRADGFEPLPIRIIPSRDKIFEYELTPATSAERKE
jgi:serine/threonine protein kinase